MHICSSFDSSTTDYVQTQIPIRTDRFKKTNQKTNSDAATIHPPVPFLTVFGIQILKSISIQFLGEESRTS